DDRVPGMREHAIPFKYLGDALRLRDAAVGALEEANNETDAEEKKRLLTFVVAGGGFSGVECIAELNDFLSTALANFPNLSLAELRCVLVQSGARILPELQEGLAGYAHRILLRRGIEIRLNTRLQAISSAGAMLFDKGTMAGEVLNARTIVSTVPTAPHALVQRLPCELLGGRIAVSETLDVPGYPGLWALGDCAAVPQRDGITSPPTAQHALRQAKTCAHNLLASLRGEEAQKFGFTGLGKLASLGRHSAVADIMGIQLRGLLAWLCWRFIYLSKVPGLDRKVRIAMDWTLDLLLPRDITQVRIFHPHDVTPEHFHAGEPIFEEGDFGNKLYVVARGQVEIVQQGATIAVLGEQEVFGEIALVSDQPRTATVRAKSDVDLISVARPAFQAIVAHLPGVQASIDEILRSHGVEPHSARKTLSEQAPS
ncbi:MAG: FAD-dependent oxidoreductase, partial [Planctomycetales bacterium]|nr:FAD-dependent oxidoreductase [Planctomycetales bacterium]